MPRAVSFTLNGKPVRLETDDKRTLLWVLRTDLGLTGTKYGCGVGACGSCTVVVDGKAVRSCRSSLADVEGRTVTTIEGLASGGKLHPLQPAFIDHGGFQCGYCTPGQIMAAEGLLRANPDPSADEIRHGMSGNLCRCGAYPHIANAVAAAATQKKGGK